MKTFNKIGLVIALMIVFAFGANAQFYAYNSFVNGYNLQVFEPTAQTLVTNLWGGTNVANSWGYNNYVYPGTYPITSNNAYIGSNTIFGTQSAFGLYTNTQAIVDARVWPDNNSDVATAEGLFVSITGANTATTNAYTLSFAPVVTVPITIPMASSSYFPTPLGTQSISNDVAMTQAQNLFSLSLTANGLTPVNIITNPPSALFSGPSKWRLVSVASTTTNVVGFTTNQLYTSVLTNGVWQIVTNSAVLTNYGAIYVNAGIVGYPPFHSP